MASNCFGNIFCITTWGESHGPAIGVVIDGCPSGVEISAADIQVELEKRSPGKSPYTTARKESDSVQLLSGVFEGVTTGAPISLMIMNEDAQTTAYTPTKDLLKPGHANYTYLEKYGVFDYRGGGRASARETACRVAAGAIAKKFLKSFGIEVIAYLSSIGEIESRFSTDTFSEIKEAMEGLDFPCPDKAARLKMQELILKLKEEGDSIGGVVELTTSKLPVGLGDPVYEKLEANLAKAMLSLPASKAFEIGEGFKAASMQGSKHNDLFVNQGGQISLKTNQSGGTLGGISNGSSLVARVGFKPASSIKITQETVDVEGKPRVFEAPKNSRHDPCVAIRAVPVVEAMTALVLADAVLMNHVNRCKCV